MQNLVALLFWVVLVTSFALVIGFGSRSAKVFIVLLGVATVLTDVVQTYARTSTQPLAYFAIDAFVLAIGLLILIRTDAFWPIWFCGFHLISVASQLARLVVPSAIPEMYANVAGFWAVPALVTMAIGVCKDRAAGLTQSTA